ncbi:hypothetical protein [Paucibacter soli]|uniref:hypothetical protein n=1 Tax=Paucibacter soli TaxID=3133433 RepID=UPI0030B1B7C3
MSLHQQTLAAKCAAAIRQQARSAAFTRINLPDEVSTVRGLTHGAEAGQGHETHGRLGAKM